MIEEKTDQPKSMSHFTLKVDEVDGSVLYEMRGEKSKPRTGAFLVERTQANTSAFEVVLLNLRHNLIGSNRRTCTEGGKPG